MKRNIYMVIHEINETNGGGTTICMGRTNLFNTKKYNSNVLTFDFKPNYKKIEYKMKSLGKFSEDSSIINMYDFFREHKKALNEPIIIHNDKYIKNNLITNYYNVFKDEGIDLNKYEISQQSDCFLKLNNNDKYIEFDFADSLLYRVKISNFENNEIKEKYFSQDGFCFLVKYVELPTNKTNSIYLNYEDYNFRFENEKGLENYFLNLLINNTNQNGSEAIFIIDGQGSLRRALNLSKKNCQVYFALHTNHHLKPYTNDSKIAPNKETILRNIDQINGLVVLTERQKRDIINVYGNKKNIFVIPNYIKKNKIKKSAKSKNKVVMVSRLAKGKRIDKALNIFKEVVKKVPQAKLEIYGEGNEKENLKEMVTKLKLENNVFIKGHTNNVMEKFSEANINIMTSETEAFPSIIIEAFLCQTPTVSLDINYGPSDLIDSKVDGMIAQNENEMVDILISLLKKPEKTKKMGVIGQKKMLTQLSGANILKKWESMFKQSFK